MAIFHAHISVGSRSKGISAQAACAYRAGEKIVDDMTGQVWDYSKKKGVAHSEILLPEGASPAYKNRGFLWQSIEASEKRKDAQLFREFEFALPTEFARDLQISVIQDFCKPLVARGVVCDFNIHDKGDGNPHVHILTTLRPLEGDKWGDKKSLTDLNSRSKMDEWRAGWADICNAKLPFYNQIDHRTLKAQGKDYEPTEHEGVRPSALRDERKERNRARRAIRQASKDIQEATFDLKALRAKEEKDEREKQAQKNAKDFGSTLSRVESSIQNQLKPRIFKKK